MKNSEPEIMTKQQKATVTRNSKNNAKHINGLKETFANMINKSSKTNAPSTSDEEENLSSGEEGDDVYTDIDSQSETSEEESSSSDKDSDTESSNSDENEDVIIKRYISNHLDEIIDDAGVYVDDDDDDDVDVDDSEDEEDSDEDEDGDDDDDEDGDYDEDYEDASFDDFLNEISYNFLMSDEMFNNDIYSEPEQDNPSYADVIITEVNDDVIKEVDGWKDNETKTEGGCSEAKPIN